jgi:hypothetical protein
MDARGRWIPAHQWGKTKVSTTPLNVLINFRVPTTTRKLLREYAKHHNVNVSWLLRFHLEKFLQDIERDGLPPALEMAIKRYRLDAQANAVLQEIKELRVHAYRKAEAISFSKRIESVQNGLDQHTSDPVLNILNDFTPEIAQHYTMLQYKIIALETAYEETFENQEEIQEEKNTE